MKTPEDIAAVLLAAGRSRRMGAFKPLLPFGGSSVVEACVANLRAACVREVVVVVGHRAEEVRAALDGLSFVRFALNDEPGSEMGVSVARGVVSSMHEDKDNILASLNLVLAAGEFAAAGGCLPVDPAVVIVDLVITEGFELAPGSN